MGDDYDDWGHPTKPRYRPRDQSVKGVLRSWYYLIRRKYQTLTATILIGLCLFWYLNTEGEPKPAPVDWKRFAYVQYVTDNHNLCNAYMVFEALHRYKSKADRILLYPQEWDLEDDSEQDRNSQLLIRAKKYWNVKLHPVALLDTDGKASPGTLNAPSSWSTSITKLRAFELYQYDRVLHMDSDITLLQHMDDLFLAPSAAVAMPRAYWSDTKPSEWPLTSLLMLIEPNPLEMKNFIDILMSWKLKPGFQIGRNYDMDLLNHRFGASAMVLPHRAYAMLSAEFRQKDHSAYLGTINGPRERMSKLTWDPDHAYQEAKLIHFSDWPLPKPWIMWPHEGLAEMQPDCDGSKLGCREREIWKGLYSDFRKRRKDLCRILSVPAPKWSDLKNQTAS
ncbi:glycosyltransferase family 8 protein [Zasmidium cellare ATCC 36951]|uniref:Glycosyltransferase family 8 protein n=1 Tax=Zasmidium cellare ATCC 36951 TaxID=1080233 RepID=A0A6A6D3K9_ZASCE|nr:glycosyltransferase family 8 protein [Zasmidium cellare ATCC 36951]KAF2174004.1 glycosyltransferase family 8 protein [Zasmidium cellare ATCC 36951]